MFVSQRQDGLNISKIETRLDRQIVSFPSAFKIEHSPYYGLDFSDVTYERCLKDARKISNGFNISKVIVLGDVCVGKTSIVNRFCHKFFETNYKSTIGVDFEVEQFEILGVSYNLQIWDTAGQERFKSIAQSYYRGANAIILVFDFTKTETLRNCKNWLQEAIISVVEYPYIFLVGTKKDLMKRGSLEAAEMFALTVASQINAEYWPVSSKTGENINELFHRIAALTFDGFIKNENNFNRQIQIGTTLIKRIASEDVRNKQAVCTCGATKCAK